jgi:hypothetical protein
LLEMIEDKRSELIDLCARYGVRRLALFGSALRDDFDSGRSEGPMDGVRAVRASSECLGETLLVELVDGVAHGLRITTEVGGDLVGVLASVAGEQDLATTQGEGIRRTQTRLQGLTLGVTQSTHEDRSFHSVEDNH